jgi:hypothetical protein
VEGKSTIQNFDSADGNFAKSRNLAVSPERFANLTWPFANFSISPIEKAVRARNSRSGILSFRYVACNPDNVVDARKHNGHTN